MFYEARLGFSVKLDQTWTVETDIVLLCRAMSFNAVFHYVVDIGLVDLNRNCGLSHKKQFYHKKHL